MKKIFTLIAAMLLCLSVSAKSISVGAPTNNADGWYDATTKLITFVEAKSYKPGWWMAWDNTAGANVGKDYSDYDNFVVEFAEAPGFAITVYFEYMDETITQTIVTGTATETKITVPLDATGKSKVKQAYLQVGEDGVGKTVTFKDAYFENSEAAATSAVIYTGSDSDKYIDWDSNKVQASLDDNAKSMLVAGNVLRIEFDEDSAADYWQIQVMGSWWTILETTKTMTADYITDINLNEGKNAILSFAQGATYLNITLSDADIATLNEQGAILLCGANIKIKSIAIYTSESLPTSISTIKSESTIDNDAYYNLSGQRVAKPSKGLYIHNGKKVIIK